MFIFGVKFASSDESFGAQLLTTTKHLLSRAVNGAAGKAGRPLTAMAAGAKKSTAKHMQCCEIMLKNE